jgi:hypothetical protein
MTISIEWETETERIERPLGPRPAAPRHRRRRAADALPDRPREVGRARRRRRPRHLSAVRRRAREGRRDAGRAADLLIRVRVPRPRRGGS